MSRPFPFSNPLSVIQHSPQSGVFGSSAYVADKEGFVAKVIAKWYMHRDNTIPVETMAHVAQAELLHGFYLKYRQEADQYSVSLGCVLHVLAKSGSIKEAEIALAGMIRLVASSIIPF